MKKSTKALVLALTGLPLLAWALLPWCYWPVVARIEGAMQYRWYGVDFSRAPWYLRADWQLHVLTVGAVTAWLLVCARQLPGRWWWLPALILPVIASVGDEALQFFAPGRNALLDDLLASLAGWLMAVSLWLLLRFLVRTRQGESRRPCGF